MKTIGHISKTFLKISQTFVYRQILDNSWYRHAIFAKKRLNKKVFPIDGLVLYKEKTDLIHILKENQVDLIHAHFAPNAINVLEAKMLLKIPMLTFIHGYDATKVPRLKAKNRRNYKLLFENGDLFAVPSEAILKELLFLGCPANKLVVCRLGIDLKLFPFQPRTLDGDVIRLISVGRLVEKKGHHHLIEALSYIRDSVPPFHLTIIGDGKLKNYLINLTLRHGLQDRVSFLGSVRPPAVLSELQKAHIFCLASITGRKGDMEGLPVSILEAQATGLPVISTRHSGIPEAVLDGRSGFLAEEGNIKELAQKLLDLMNQPKRWTEFGSEGRIRVTEHFDAKKSAEELKGLYDRLINGTAR
ncbi:glycosyltransferase [Ammoniphilus sp. 3BR4]|uniref:glycosyltransferase n=1 Tax=Ammoniphilus sp. 3BR4 TaxID=3158265 RepID=UPI0034659629